ncbi:MAG TPA: tryptophan 7-halogenase [Alloacidobacterium sp.]|nr:tryptophan 7-halogenase [Alloacidobacterium sp.]
MERPRSLTNPVHYDVTILGGGPAGNAAALSLKRLRPSLKVLVVEASRNHQWQVGETLSPGCKSILQSLGCWEPFRAECFIESFGTSSAWGNDRASDNEFIFSLGGSGYHVDRLRFEHLLSNCSQQAGAELLSGFHVAAQEFAGGHGWHLTLRSPSSIQQVETHFVVDATGRSASFAVQNGAHRMADDRLMGVFTRFTFPSGLAPKDPRTLIEAQQDGWWYSALTPDACIVVAWMSDADLIRARALHLSANWLNHLQRSRLTSARIAQGQPELPPRLQAAQSQILTRTSGPGWVATGDAATALDPLSSQGILKALRTGKLASFVALDALTGRPSTQSRYDALLVRDYEQFKETKTWFYSQEQRWAQSPFWSRRRA